MMAMGLWPSQNIWTSYANVKILLCGIWLDKILNKRITVYCNVQEGAGFSVKQKQPRGQKLQIGKFIRTCAILFPNCHPAQALKTKVPITVVTANMLLAPKIGISCPKMSLFLNWRKQNETFRFLHEIIPILDVSRSY